MTRTRIDKQTNRTQESKSRSSHIWTQLSTFWYISPNEYEKKIFLVMEKLDSLFNKQWKKFDSYLYSPPTKKFQVDWRIICDNIELLKPRIFSLH